MSISINGTNGLTFNDGSSQQTAASGFGFKNRIINGACMIDQRNAGASVTSTSGANYPVDRFFIIKDTATTGVMTAQQSTTAPAGFTNSVKLTTTTAQASLAATDYVRYSQIIEGYNVADLGFGSANAKTVTLSFWVRSSLTGTFGGSLGNSAWNRTYPFTYTISAADTWEQKSITIAGDTSGTWLTDNGKGLRVDFGLGVGSTYSGTAGAWAGALYISATGATSVVGTNAATWYITGVQLEKGSTATSFDYRPYGTELALCQRYFLSYNSRIYSGTGDAGFGVGSTRGDATLHAIMFYYPVQMRSTPTMTQNQCQILDNWNYGLAVTGVGGMQSNVQSGVGYFTTGAGATAYRTAYINNIYPRTDSYVNFSAEL